MSKTIFADFFGNSNEVKIIDFFIDNSYNNYSIKEIKEFVKIDSKALNRLLKKFTDSKILKIYKKDKNINYRLNLKNNIVLKIFQLDWELIKSEVHIT